MKEETLSDKKTEIPTGDIIEGYEEWYWGYYERDVIEYINKLKNQIIIDRVVSEDDGEYFKELIDEIMGERLR